ncbi:glycosyltransferase family 32 protein [Pectobacterium carotovorum]|uniref:glycosyltransferase family 32 protein n=1 Tax=Pectobacterium carotovorum TaxID=554 RepID=UPI00301A7F29
MIPKVIHIIWIGDESKRPNESILSWVEKNPEWEVKLWGNDELAEYPWTNSKHMIEMANRGELCGVADLMRLEILYHEGGFYVDADSFCMKPLEDWLFHCNIFACWENEIAMPGLIANTYIAAEINNDLLGQMIIDLNNMSELPGQPAWIIVGPKFLTDSYHKYKYSKMIIWPSHLFLPTHHSGAKYDGDNTNAFARHEWGTTHNIYGNLS